MRNHCPNKDKWKELDKSKSEGAKKVEEEKAKAATEFAGKASAVSEHEVNSTSSNVFDWNTDTGATSHMTHHRSWIRNYTPYRVPIKLADNRIIHSEGVGSVVLDLLSMDILVEMLNLLESFMFQLYVIIFLLFYT